MSDETRNQLFAEAVRYDRLADEAERELAAMPPEYYRKRASDMRREACCVMKHGTIVNAAPELIGKTALMRDHESDCDLIMLQFDDMTLEYEGKFLAFGWHTFHRDSFETDEEMSL